MKSDNLEALASFYKGLTSDEERTRFVKALLDRLDEKRGYLSVSYFIVAVLYSVGSLPEALQKARRDLPAGEDRVFGLSNVLMLLNGLLRYRHSDFTNQMLDEIEHMTHGLNEHPFMIPAEIAAIRASRLSGPRSPAIPVPSPSSGGPLIDQSFVQADHCERIQPAEIEKLPAGTRPRHGYLIGALGKKPPQTIIKGLAR